MWTTVRMVVLVDKGSFTGRSGLRVLTGDAVRQPLPCDEDVADGKGSLVDGLYYRYSISLKRFLRRVLDNDQDVADTAQEAYLRLWQQECQGRLRQTARAYLFQTAMNLVRDRRRADRVREVAFHSPFEDEEYATSSPLADDIVHWRRNMAVIGESIKALPQMTRAIFLAYHVNNHSYQKIAADFDVTTRTVERHMSRALKHCRTYLEDFV